MHSSLLLTGIDVMHGSLLLASNYVAHVVLYYLQELM
jgi:hypothetical protein